MKSWKLKKVCKPYLLVVAGEVSGDQLFASILATSNLQRIYHFFGCGGAKMQEQGVEILYNVHDMEAIGFSEIILKYSRLRSFMKMLVHEARERSVRDALLIDYPGFNLRLAEKLSRFGIRCHFIVSPQLWAWNYKRIYRMEKFVKNVLCLYEFETKIYEQHNISAHFMGHPLIYKIRTKIKNVKNQPQKILSIKYVCLLPGSRKQEIDRMLLFMLSLCKEFQKKNSDRRIQFLLPCPNNGEIIKKIKEYTAAFPGLIKLIPGGVHEALAKSHVAIACSGTVTLECFLWGVPFLLLYMVSWPTYWVAKYLVHIPYIGIVNVMQGAFVHQEFIQKAMKKKEVMLEFDKLMFDEPYRQKMINTFQSLLEQIPFENPACKAREIIKSIVSL